MKSPQKFNSSLNKYMHPRNRYKNNKPSFLELALKYPDFRKQVTQDESGKVFLDFKNADALRALTTCLLKEDFGLQVHLPSDRLVPTLPLRLNYIHWIEDIIGMEPGKWGIDVGTGASCVYPLLAATLRKWNFLATEADQENYFHAQKNVEANSLTDSIHVKQVSVEDVLCGPVESSHLTKRFDFCMCNPPFFADHMEAQAVTTSRSVDRPEAHSVSTASPQECIASGGEVGFLRQMIEESVLLQDKIRVYTSMVGKKSSLAQLKEELRQHKVPKFSTTEFCQGKTMRWGIAWSFDATVSFPKSQFEARKDKPPLQYVIPVGTGCLDFNVHSTAKFIKEFLTSLKIHCHQGKTAKSYTSITLTAAENSWCHQRRRRRQQKRQEEERRLKAEKETSDGGDISSHDDITVNTEMTVTPADVAKTDIAPDTKGQVIERASNKGSVAPTIDCKEKCNSYSTSGDNSTHPISVVENKLVIDDTQIENVAADEKEEMIYPRKKLFDGDDGSENPAKKLRLEDASGQNSCQEVQSTTGKVTILNGSAIVPEPDTSASSKSQSHLPQSVNNDSLTATNLEEVECPKQFVLKCVLRLKRVTEGVYMEMEWLDGDSRELLHQLYTCLVNKLGQQRAASSKTSTSAP